MERLMRLAEVDIERNAALHGASVVYTCKGVTADASGLVADAAIQGASNAAV
jgi:hypothetical protein